MGRVHFEEGSIENEEQADEFLVEPGRRRSLWTDGAVADSTASGVREPTSGAAYILCEHEAGRLRSKTDGWNDDGGGGAGVRGRSRSEPAGGGPSAGSGLRIRRLLQGGAHAGVYQHAYGAEQEAVCIGIEAALGYLASLPDGGGDGGICVATDCLSLLQAARSQHCRTDRELRVVELLNELAGSRRVVLKHVRGRSGVALNCEADRLAKWHMAAGPAAGAVQDSTLGYARCHFDRVTKFGRREAVLTSQSEMRQHFRLATGMSQDAVRVLDMEMPRPVAIALTQLATGYSPMCLATRHLQGGDCECCSSAGRPVQDTTWHLLSACPRASGARARCGNIFGKIVSMAEFFKNRDGAAEFAAGISEPYCRPQDGGLGERAEDNTIIKEVVGAWDDVGSSGSGAALTAP
eukprot:gene423-155_t